LTARAGGRVRLAREGQVAVLTLDHQPSRNAVDAETFQRLTDILLSLRDDPGTGAVLLTASGPHFSSGADIAEPLPTEAALEAQDLAVHPAALLRDFPRPTVTALHGCCIGGGLELALATDIRIAADDAWFRFAEVTVGLPTGWGGGSLLADVVGRGRALDLLLSGRWVDAAEALAMGLVTRTCEPGLLQQTAAEAAAELAGRSPAAVYAIKQAVGGGDFRSALRAEIRNFGAAAATPEAARLIADFLARPKGAR
jgi:enoyl-CoA hydratase/carnithine racemase